MASFKQYNVRRKANDGIKMELILPDGTASDDWLIIRGIDSDEFIRARDELNRQYAMDQVNINALAGAKQVVGELKGDDHKQAMNHIKIVEELIRSMTPESERKVMLQASLIKEWSFEEECSLDNRLEFLRGNPTLADQIDTLAADRKAFYQKK